MLVTPGYSGHWPGYSGHGVSIFLIWSSGPHNHLNKKISLSLSLTLTLSRYLSLPHLPHELSLSSRSSWSSWCFSVTPGYSGHWPGYSERGVSISLI